MSILPQLPNPRITAPCTHLLDLPPEIIYHILTFLDLQSLIACSRTSHTFRPLSLHPSLHRLRLQHARQSLARLLPERPPLSLLKPPHSSIYLKPQEYRARKLLWRLSAARLSRHLALRPSRADLVARGILLPEQVHKGVVHHGIARNAETSKAAKSLSRDLRKIRLSRGLERRPSVRSLVDRGVLPAECCGVDPCGSDVRGAGGGRDGRRGGRRLVLGGKGSVSPGLVGLKRGLEKERVKDGLRGWVAGKLRARQERVEMERLEGLDVGVGEWEWRFGGHGGGGGGDGNSDYSRGSGSGSKVRALVGVYTYRGLLEGATTPGSPPASGVGFSAAAAATTSTSGTPSSKMNGNTATGGNVGSDQGPSRLTSMADWKQKVKNEGRWGRGRKERDKRYKEQPTRAKVLGLRRFWEGVIQKSKV